MTALSQTTAPFIGGAPGKFKSNVVSWGCLAILLLGLESSPPNLNSMLASASSIEKGKNISKDFEEKTM